MTLKEQEAVTHRVCKKFEPDVERNEEDASKPVVVVVVVVNVNKQSQSLQFNCILLRCCVP